MNPYLDRQGDSGVAAYECGSAHIRVQFRSGRTYRYSYAGFGSGLVEPMQRIAAEGDGLNAFIRQVVDKWRC